MEQSKKKNKTVFLIAGIHFLLSVVYRMYFYQYLEDDSGIFTSAVTDSQTFYSDMAERIVSTLISGAFGFLLIFVIWYVILQACREIKAVVAGIVLFSCMVAVLAFPACFDIETDTYILYHEAVRDILDYWQSMYTTCIYNACLLVFPDPVIIPVIQLSGFLGTLYYITRRTYKIFDSKLAWMFWLIVLSPECFEIALSPYRGCINTIMCMLFFSIIFMDVAENRKRADWQILLMSLGVAFLTVFRSEQILFPIIWSGILYFVYFYKNRRWIRYVFFTIIFCLLLAFPQKLGDRKYYGKEYTVINKMETLAGMFREDELNISYEGAAEDIQKINALVPIEKLCASGLMGYRGHLFANRNDFNDFSQKAKRQEQFLKAADHLILKNIGIFLKVRWNIFLGANNVPVQMGSDFTEEVSAMYDAYAMRVYFGAVEVYKDSWVLRLLYQNPQNGISDRMIGFWEKLMTWFGEKTLFLAVRCVVFILFSIMVCRLYGHKDVAGEVKKIMVVILLMLYAQIAAIFLLSPDDRNTYYYTVFYILLVGDMILGLYDKKVRIENKY